MIRRICFIYLCLYSIPAILLGTLPAPSPLAELYEKPWQGNDCLQVACYAVIAAVTAVVWRRMDERWPRTYLRYALALTLFGYGMAKVIPQQFPFPPLERMVTPFGESSPRGLLWTFMGYSRAYSVFAGASELLAGLLLCFRRTATLGALLAAGLLANVALINFGYDVQLKVFSLHQLFIAVLLLLPEVRRLADFFLLGKPVAAAEAVPASRLGLALKTLLIGYALISSAIYAQAAVKRRLREAGPLRHLPGRRALRGELGKSHHRQPFGVHRSGHGRLLQAVSTAVRCWPPCRDFSHRETRAGLGAASGRALHLEGNLRWRPIGGEAAPRRPADASAPERALI
jgi:hypothetical protein